jgi:glycosyltransferase involved in cell wall biosynthesis
MKVAFLIQDARPHGANKCLLTVLEGLQDLGVSVYVLSAADGLVIDKIKALGITVEIIPFKWWMSIKPVFKWSFYRLLKNISLIFPIIRLLNKWKIDVIYSNSLVIGIGAIVSFLLGKPHVWHIHEFGDLDYGFKFDWGKRISGFIVNLSRKKTTCSRAVQNYLNANLSLKDVQVVYNGIFSTTQFNDLYKKSHEYQKADSLKFYTFALVGFLFPNKGHEEALRGFSITVRKKPNIRLLIVGSGSPQHTNKLHILVEELGIADKVEFWGYLDDPSKAYLEADAVLTCSQCEAASLAILEAMATCRPVIGSARGGTPEFVENEKTGILYSNGPKDLSNCMLRFIENPDWARQLGENGWKIAREKYTTESYISKIYKILCAVTKSV